MVTRHRERGGRSERTKWGRIRERGRERKKKVIARESAVRERERGRKRGTSKTE